MSKSPHLFTSERLRFRQWRDSDIESMAAISADKEVMKHFPSTKSLEETIAFVELMHEQQEDLGHCFFAVDLIDSKEFIGFIGLSTIMYHIDFAPAVEVGWRLAAAHWNKGFATEGAKRCLEYGFEHVGLQKIVSIAPKVNEQSVSVMQKIGMSFEKEFKHPLLADFERLEECVLYSKEASTD